MNPDSKSLHRIFLLTLWVLPFYLPIAVLAASNFGSIYVLSAWKELILLALILLLIKPILGLVRGKDSTVRLLNISIALYVCLSLLYIVRADSLFEFVGGFLFSTRFLLFFIVAQILATRVERFPERIKRIILISGTVLAGIAVLQALVLPPTFLQHIGYEPIGIETPGFPPSVTTLGEVDDFIRPQATLRGPNPLGAFLVLPFCLLLLKLADKKGRDIKTFGAWLLVGAALLFTFSRSAWLAAFIGTAGSLLYVYRSGFIGIKKSYVLTAVALTIFTAVVALNNKTVRLIVFREDTVTSKSVSDDTRSSLTREAWSDVTQNPLGRGPGNAGPVSVLDTNDRGRIAENYFLQVAQETGWLGLLLFVTIHGLLLKKLWELRKNNLAMLAFATLCGFIVANLTLHTWADETVSIMWWSFAGAIIGSYTHKKRAR